MECTIGILIQSF